MIEAFGSSQLMDFVICKTCGKAAKGLDKVCLFHVGVLLWWAEANKCRNGSTQTLWHRGAKYVLIFKTPVMHTLTLN